MTRNSDWLETEWISGRMADGFVMKPGGSISSSCWL